jgi:hypothetical protein
MSFRVGASADVPLVLRILELDRVAQDIGVVEVVRVGLRHLDRRETEQVELRLLGRGDPQFFGGVDLQRGQL